MYLLDDFTVSLNEAVFALIAVAVIIVLLLMRLESNKKQYGSRIRELELLAERDDNKIELLAINKTAPLLQTWKDKELIIERNRITQELQERFDTDKIRWQLEWEQNVRKDARNRSVRNVLGKIAEHLVPFSMYLEKYNSKDIRFIGSPIDFLIFDGVEEGREDVKIIFVELKTGNSALTKRQLSIRRAIREKNVDWLPINLKDIKDHLQSEGEE